MRQKTPYEDPSVYVKAGYELLQSEVTADSLVRAFVQSWYAANAARRNGSKGDMRRARALQDVVKKSMIQYVRG